MSNWEGGARGKVEIGYFIEEDNRDESLQTVSTQGGIHDYIIMSTTTTIASTTQCY
jgi:hypothetical protein